MIYAPSQLSSGIICLVRDFLGPVRQLNQSELVSVTDFDKKSLKISKEIKEGDISNLVLSIQDLASMLCIVAPGKEKLRSILSIILDLSSHKVTIPVLTMNGPAPFEYSMASLIECVARNNTNCQDGKKGSFANDHHRELSITHLIVCLTISLCALSKIGMADPTIAIWSLSIGLHDVGKLTAFHMHCFQNGVSESGHVGYLSFERHSLDSGKMIVPILNDLKNHPVIQDNCLGSDLELLGNMVTNHMCQNHMCSKEYTCENHLLGPHKNQSMYDDRYILMFATLMIADRFSVKTLTKREIWEQMYKNIKAAICFHSSMSNYLPKDIYKVGVVPLLGSSGSGKSAIARKIVEWCTANGVDCTVLSSDHLTCLDGLKILKDIILRGDGKEKQNVLNDIMQIFSYTEEEIVGMANTDTGFFEHKNVLDSYKGIEYKFLRDLVHSKNPGYGGHLVSNMINALHNLVIDESHNMRPLVVVFDAVFTMSYYDKLSAVLSNAYTLNVMPVRTREYYENDASKLGLSFPQFSKDVMRVPKSNDMDELSLLKLYLASTGEMTRTSAKASIAHATFPVLHGNEEPDWRFLEFSISDMCDSVKKCARPISEMSLYEVLMTLRIKTRDGYSYEPAYEQLRVNGINVTDVGNHLTMFGYSIQVIWQAPRYTRECRGTVYYLNPNGEVSIIRDALRRGVEGGGSTKNTESTTGGVGMLGYDSKHSCEDLYYIRDSIQNGNTDTAEFAQVCEKFTSILASSKSDGMCVTCTAVTAVSDNVDNDSSSFTSRLHEKTLELYEQGHMPWYTGNTIPKMCIGTRTRLTVSKGSASIPYIITAIMQQMSCVPPTPMTVEELTEFFFSHPVSTDFVMEIHQMYYRVGTVDGVFVTPDSYTASFEAVASENTCYAGIKHTELACMSEGMFVALDIRAKIQENEVVVIKSEELRTLTERFSVPITKSFDNIQKLVEMSIAFDKLLSNEMSSEEFYKEYGNFERDAEGLVVHFEYMGNPVYLKMKTKMYYDLHGTKSRNLELFDRLLSDNRKYLPMFAEGYHVIGTERAYVNLIPEILSEINNLSNKTSPLYLMFSEMFPQLSKFKGNQTGILKFFHGTGKTPLILEEYVSFLTKYNSVDEAIETFMERFVNTSMEKEQVQFVFTVHALISTWTKEANDRKFMTNMCAGVLFSLSQGNGSVSPTNIRSFVLWFLLDNLKPKIMDLSVAGRSAKILNGCKIMKGFLEQVKDLTDHFITVSNSDYQVEFHTRPVCAQIVLFRLVSGFTYHSG